MPDTLDNSNFKSLGKKYYYQIIILTGSMVYLGFNAILKKNKNNFGILRFGIKTNNIFIIFDLVPGRILRGQAR